MIEDIEFDWQTSSIHVDWLASFRKPKDLQVEFDAFSKLHSKLSKESIEITVRGFINTGLLIPSEEGTADHEQNKRMILSENGALLVAALKERRKKAEANAKQICFQALLNGDLDEAYRVKIKFNAEFHSTRGFIRLYKISDFQAFTLTALKSTLSLEFVDDPDKWMSSVGGETHFKSNFLRWASRLNHKVIENAEERDANHLRAAFFMIHLWNSEKSITWIPKHLQVTEPITDFRPPEIQIEATKIEESGEGKSLFFSKTGRLLSVEEVALEYYHGKGFQGVHLENRCWWVICYCLYWDIIYAKIPYVQEYLTRMRADSLLGVPPDFHSKIFYRRRSSLITARHQQLEQIASECSSGIVKQFTEAWKKFRALFPETRELNPTPIDQHIEIIGLLSIGQLIAICDRILRDPGTNSKGFPDLFLTRHNQIQLVEVKQPKEKIMDHQVRWHEFFTDIGISVEVCRVVST